MSTALVAVVDLPVAWRKQAGVLREFAPYAAAAFDRAADELETALRIAGDDVLRLKDAAKESGYSEDHLRRLIREGVLPNVGRRHAPRVLRSALPRKPKRFDAQPNQGYDPIADARQVAAVRNRGDKR